MDGFRAVFYIVIVHVFFYSPRNTFVFLHRICAVPGSPPIVCARMYVCARLPSSQSLRWRFGDWLVLSGHFLLHTEALIRDADETIAVCVCVWILFSHSHDGSWTLSLPPVCVDVLIHVCVCVCVVESIRAVLNSNVVIVPLQPAVCGCVLSLHSPALLGSRSAWNCFPPGLDWRQRPFK